MHPAVIPAVLLLVGILNTVTAQNNGFASRMCDEYPNVPCDDGWSRIDENLCAKFIGTKKNFMEAQEHCENTFKGNLVSLHDELGMINTLCLTVRADPEVHTVWIGGKKGGKDFEFTDGSEFYEGGWKYGQPEESNDRECIESDIKADGFWSNVPCTEEKSFVCAKKM